MVLGTQIFKIDKKFSKRITPISLYKSNQGSKDKTLVYKLKYIPNDYTQNSLFCRLQLVVEMFGTQPTK